MYCNTPESCSSVNGFDGRDVSVYCSTDACKSGGFGGFANLAATTTDSFHVFCSGTSACKSIEVQCGNTDSCLLQCEDNSGDPQSTGSCDQSLQRCSLDTPGLCRQRCTEIGSCLNANQFCYNVDICLIECAAGGCRGASTQQFCNSAGECSCFLLDSTTEQCTGVTQNIPGEPQ